MHLSTWLCIKAIELATEVDEGKQAMREKRNLFCLASTSIYLLTYVRCVFLVLELLSVLSHSFLDSLSVLSIDSIFLFVFCIVARILLHSLYLCLTCIYIPRSAITCVHKNCLSSCECAFLVLCVIVR